MHRFKAVTVIGLSVAAAMVAMDHLPTLLITHMIFMNALSPGLIVSAIFSMSNDASLFNGMVALALAWAVNTTFYYAFWRIALVAKRQISPRPRNQTPT
jgi:hypothetical protein